jgi:sugar lactone lactonase YvrE
MCMFAPMMIGSRLFLLAVAWPSFASAVMSHPSSGIVVNDRGEVFFVHSTRGLARVGVDGKLTFVHQSTGGHWLCLDRQGSFARTQLKHFFRVTPEGERPGIIFADGGAPIAVCRDGDLYYGSSGSAGHELEPGALAVSRLSPGGTASEFAPKLKEVLASRKVGVTGLAAGPDGRLYVASATGLYRVAMDGAVTILVDRPEVTDCDPHPPPDGLPGFQGLDVSSNGTVYAAATGCGTLIKVSASSGVETVLKSETPWSPASVAIHGPDLYVLEWTNPNRGPREGWRPRVRKLAGNGKVTTLVTIAENVVP